MMSEKTVQITVSAGLRDAIKEGKGEHTYEDFLWGLVKGDHEGDSDAFKKFSEELDWADTLPPSCLDQLDTARGDLSREDFVTDMLETRAEADRMADNFEKRIAKTAPDALKEALFDEFINEDAAVEVVCKVLLDSNLHEICHNNPGRDFLERQARLALGLITDQAEEKTADAVLGPLATGISREAWRARAAWIASNTTAAAPSPASPSGDEDGGPSPAPLDPLGPDESGFESEQGDIAEIPELKEKAP